MHDEQVEQHGEAAEMHDERGEQHGEVAEMHDEPLFVPL
jgi:hypothetical protein